MAVNPEETAKSDFSSILSNLKRKFQITHSKWTDHKSYEIKFRTQISIEQEDYNKYCDEWVDEFSYVTDTVWVHKISNTGPKVKFRKQYQCWTYEQKEVDKELLFDARKCSATLDIKVLGNSLEVKKRNKFLRLGLNVLVKVNFHHLHSVDSSRQYSFFVHWCQPLPEAPKIIAPSSERVSELVAKVVENAPLSVQKAAKRAEEALKRQCRPSPSINQTDTIPTDNQLLHSTNSTPLLPITAVVATDTSPVDKSIPCQVVVTNVNGTTRNNILYIQHRVFDPSTNTLREIVSTPVNSDLHVIEVQVPQPQMQITQVINVCPSDGQMIQNF